MTRDPATPRLPFVVLAIAFAAEILFLWRLGVPHKVMFDEIHYVPAARTLAALTGPTNIEHPLLGKALIAAGIALFGDTSFGWRFFSTVAGTAVVIGVFAIARQMIGGLRPPVLGALFTMLNFTVYIQARIGMLDGFMAAFVVLAIAALLWSMAAPARWVMPRVILGAVLMGLACGTKWAAVPFVGYAGLAIIVLRLRDAKVAGRDLESALYPRDQVRWRGQALLPLLLVFAGVTAATYLLTFLPAFLYAHDAMSLGDLLPFQGKMYAEQTQVLPAHTYQSDWWSWPLDIRPIWYLYERVDGAQRGVLMIGNPAIMWGGLIAVAACLYGWWRDKAPRLLAVAMLWIAAFGIWAIIPKSLGFFYYYYLPSIFLCLALAAAFDHFVRRGGRRWDAYFLVLSAGSFAYFYPILSAAALAGPQSFRHWMWLPTWP